MSLTPHVHGPSIRSPAVAGTFYPGAAVELARQVDALLASARPAACRPKALIVPHAGYVYSGPIAATAYATVAAMKPRPTKVVLLGPSHHVGFEGLALPGVDALSTPLGLVPVDVALAARVHALPFVGTSALAHRKEHSLEVHLPFLQRVLDEFTVLPLVVGEAEPDEVARVLDAVWGGDETLIIVSSDLSHYLPFEEARVLDAETAKHIDALDPSAVDSHDACGSYPVRGLLVEAKAKGLHVEQLDLRNSGDTSGDRSRVVGYGSFAFVAPTQVFDGTLLLRLARSAIAEEFGGPRAEVPPEPWLHEKRAVFVTLTKHGELRGCIGQLAPRFPLHEAVWEAARSAAFRDGRFAPLTREELDEVRLEVSVLSPLESLEVNDEADFLAKVRPGIDGVVLSHDFRSGLFIPQMWEQLPEKEQFLVHLKRKAGLPLQWLPGTKVQRFTAVHWEEPE